MIDHGCETGGNNEICLGIHIFFGLTPQLQRIGLAHGQNNWFSD